MPAGRFCTCNVWVSRTSIRLFRRRLRIFLARERGNLVHIPQSTPQAAPLRLVQLAVANLERLTLSQPVELSGLSVCAGALPPAVVAARRLAQYRDGVDRLWCVPFLVICDEDSRVVAACGFKGAPASRRVEIGYGVAPEYQRRGIALTAVQRVLEVARESGAVDEVVACTAPDNVASMKVLGRAGFVRGAEVIDPCGELVVEWRIRIGD